MKSKLKTVYTRLFTEDVEEIRARAQIHGAPFQVELRMLIHDAVKRQKRADPVVR